MCLEDLNKEIEAQRGFGLILQFLILGEEVTVSTTS